MDLVKLNLHMVVQFQAWVNLLNRPAATKNDAQFKNGQNRLQNNHLNSLI